MTFLAVNKIDDLWIGEMKAVKVGREEMLLVHFAGGVRAYEDLCPHQGVPLSKGVLSDCTLTCSAHHWEYDLVTGQGLNPKNSRLTCYPVQIRDVMIYVDPEKKGVES